MAKLYQGIKKKQDMIDDKAEFVRLLKAHKRPAKVLSRHIVLAMQELGYNHVRIDELSQLKVGTIGQKKGGWSIVVRAKEIAKQDQEIVIGDLVTIGGYSSDSTSKVLAIDIFSDKQYKVQNMYSGKISSHNKFQVFKQVL